MTLVGCEPVADPTAELPDAAHSPNPSDEIVAEKPDVGGLGSQPSNGSETNIDRRRSEAGVFHLQSIAHHNGSTQSESGLGTVPENEFLHGAAVGALGLRGTEAVENGRLGLFEFGQGRIPAPAATRVASGSLLGFGH